MVFVFSIIFSIFAAGNIFLPILAVPPKIREFKKRNLLVKEIPISRILIAPCIWLSLWVAAGFFFWSQDEENFREFIQGSFAGLFLLLIFLPKQKRSIERDIYKTYKDFLVPLIIWNIEGDVASESELELLADSGNKDAANALAFFWFCSNEEKREDAIRLLRGLVDEDFDPARVSLAMILLEEEKYQEVVDVVEPAAERGARNSPGLLYAALIELEEFEKADRWEKIVKESISS